VEGKAGLNILSRFFTRSRNKNKDVRWYGKIEINPLQDSIGYFDICEFVCRDELELMDVAVDVAYQITQRAKIQFRKNGIKLTPESKQHYISFEYYKSDAREVGWMSGGLYELDRFVYSFALERTQKLREKIKNDGFGVSAWNDPIFTSDYFLTKVSPKQLVQDISNSAVMRYKLIEQKYPK